MPEFSDRHSDKQDLRFKIIKVISLEFLAGNESEIIAAQKFNSLFYY